MALTETNIVNAFETTLAAQLASGGSTMNLTDDPGVAAPAYFVIAPDSDSAREVIKWDSGAYNNASVTRDLDSKHGTDPTHASGTTVRLAVVKQHIEDAHDRINDIALTGDITGTLASATQDIATSIGSGVIVNDDVNSSAAIAQSKLNLAITTSEVAAGTLVTESETITSNDNDTTIPTSAAVKNYVDAETATLTNKTLGAVTLSGAVTGGDQEVSAVVLKDYAETDVVVTSGTTLTIDLSAGNTGSVTLGHSVTDIDFTNVPTNGTSSFTLKVTQDGTGNRTMAINAITVNGGGDVTGLTAGAAGLTLSTGANDVDLVTFLFFDAGTPLINSLLDFS
tara:strand:+ start:991 stop:2007 length:1017 start_codon:yes stop_codon:yes gene_type:complete